MIDKLFKKLFPDYVVGTHNLSPYFDFFESGFEQAEQKLDEAIEILKFINDEGLLSKPEYKEWQNKIDKFLEQGVYNDNK